MRHRKASGDEQPGFGGRCSFEDGKRDGGVVSYGGDSGGWNDVGVGL